MLVIFIYFFKVLYSLQIAAIKKQKRTVVENPVLNSEVNFIYRVAKPFDFEALVLDILYTSTMSS